MGLSKEVLKREVDASKAAIMAHEEGAAIHKIVLKTFEKELKKVVNDKNSEKG